MKRTRLNKIGKSNISKLQKRLSFVSHSFVRERDSEPSVSSSGEYAGRCFDCGRIAHGGQFQAGHWIPDSTGGALLRYHPHNMHGQAGGCNMKYQQETVKINYTFAMIKKYGRKHVDKLRALKNKSIKADELFYLDMIGLYEDGDEERIVKYLESLV